MSHHHIRNTCPECHDVTTCRCMQPKVDTADVCNECIQISEGKKLGSKNGFAKKSKKMTIPLQMDNKDYGKATKAVARTVDMIDSGTGKYYGSKTIMTKESKQSFIQFLVTESDSDDITTLPEKVIREIKGLMRKGAADLEQNWGSVGKYKGAGALELVDKAYHVSNVRKPTPDQKGAWKQYTDLIAFGVQQLAATRGRDGKWRKTDPIAFSESLVEFAPSPNEISTRPQSDNHIGTHRFFVEIPNESAVEADAKNMDEIIEQITNKLRRNGAKARVDSRTKTVTVLSVWVGDVKRDQIVIKDIS